MAIGEMGVGPGPMCLEVRLKVPRYYPQHGNRRTHGINITPHVKILKIPYENHGASNPLKGSHFFIGSLFCAAWDVHSGAYAVAPVLRVV